MASQPDGQSCENCRFSSIDEDAEGFDGRVHEGDVGFCRRYPPIRTVDEPEANSDFAHFSFTRSRWWCGEWQSASPEYPDHIALSLARAVLLGDLNAGYALADRLIELNLRKTADLPPPEPRE